MNQFYQTILDKLSTATDSHHPQEELAQEVGRIHDQWLGYTWFKNTKETRAVLETIYVSKVELSI